MIAVSKESRNHIVERISEINDKILKTKQEMKTVSNKGLSAEEKMEYIDGAQELLLQLEAERNELELLRRNCQASSNKKNSSVDLGTRITVQFDNEEPETFNIMARSKSTEGIISPNGDLSKALLGQQAGYECEFKGQTLKLLKVEPIV